MAEESEDIKRKFEVEFGGDEQKLYEYWLLATSLSVDVLRSVLSFFIH